MVHPARAAQYTTDDIEQTPVLHERHEPGEEFGVRDREVVSIVAPSGEHAKESFLHCGPTSVSLTVWSSEDVYGDHHSQLCWW